MNKDNDIVCKTIQTERIFSGTTDPLKLNKCIVYDQMDTSNAQINIVTTATKGYSISGTGTTDLKSKTTTIGNGATTGVVLNGEVVMDGVTYNTAGGAATVSAAELIRGYHYKGVSGGAVTLTLPAIADVQTELAAQGITTAAGMKLISEVVVNETGGANAITITAGVGGTVDGTAAITGAVAVVRTLFISANTALHTVIS